MNEQIDKFAELNRRRVKGELTDAQYEHEKALLMGSGAPLGSPSAAANSPRLIKRKAVKGVIVALAVCGGLTATYLAGKSNSVAAQSDGSRAVNVTSSIVPDEHDSNDAVATVPSADTGWSIQTTSDPMTDAAVSEATAILKGNQFDAEVKVGCSSNGRIEYAILSLDKEGNPAEMRSETRLSGSRYAPEIEFQMRADDNEAMSLATFNPEYNNQVKLLSNGYRVSYMGKSIADEAENMASANQVTLRLFLLTGEETYRLDQDDAAFRAMVEPSISQIRTMRDRQIAEYAEGVRASEIERAKEPADAYSAM
jgi:hypothetical protein